LRHWVYDVVLDSGRNVVVRLSHPDHRAELAGGVFWHAQLSEVGVPVASVLSSDVDAAQPYMILERLPGEDLGIVFDQLTDVQLRRLASAVVEMQDCASRLPRAGGFGYALDYDTRLRPSWRAVLDASIDRSARWFRDVGAVDPTWVRRVRERLESTAASLDDVEPVAFLHDATTKNVIVSKGVLSGLVDVDEMAFGDPLWATALTKMSLLSARRSTFYADIQAPIMENREGRAGRLNLYTAIHCLSFLAELGQQFNQPTAAAINVTHRQHLEAVLASLL